jgi:hypothetical protein
MADGDSPPVMIVDVIPNPARFEDHPYRVRLTDPQGRTIKANFNLDVEEAKDLSALGDPKEYGAYLYRQVFEKSVSDEGDAGEIGDRVLETMNRYQGQGLRMKLKIATTLPQLHAQAWECMLDAEEGFAPAAARDLVLSRDMDVDRPVGSAVKEKPNVLLAVDSPSEVSLRKLDLQDFNVDEETRRFKNALSILGPRLSIKVAPRAAVSGKSTWESICESVIGEQFNILHVSCHGIVEDQRAKLVLSQDDGTAHLLEEAELANFLGHTSNIRLVVLDACFSGALSNPRQVSGLAIRLLQRGVPAVVGMQRTWYGPAGETFSQNFYEELCEEGFVDRAVRRARERLRSQMGGNPWNWGVPVLYLRLGEGKLFMGSSPEEAYPAWLGEGEAPRDLTLHVPEDAEEDEAPWSLAFGAAHESIPRSPAPGPDRQIIADQLSFYQDRVAQIEAQLEDAPAKTRAQLEAELTDTRSKIDEYQNLLGS